VLLRQHRGAPMTATALAQVTRPVLRWHGGKWRLAPWIISHFPMHRCYVEPYGGAGSVLIRKPRAYAEVYNDLDGAVVGLFRVLQEPTSAARLLDLLRLTPFARAESFYDEALPGWTRRECDAYADGAKPRRECLWLNPACVTALGHGPLFA
jgi:site-specific DNA-adenine methylase